MTATQTARRRDDGRGHPRHRPVPSTSTFTETKLGLKTTEFYVTVVFIAGVLLATYLDSDTLTRSDGFRYRVVRRRRLRHQPWPGQGGRPWPYIDDDSR